MVIESRSLAGPASDIDAPVERSGCWLGTGTVRSGVVDLASGAHIVADPPGSQSMALVLPGTELRRADERDAMPNRFDARGTSLEVLLVRPRQGAWRLSLGDGDPDDLDGQPNGRIQWGPSAGRPVAASPRAPRDFAPGDVVIGVDPNRLEYYEFQAPR